MHVRARLPSFLLAATLLFAATARAEEAAGQWRTVVEGEALILTLSPGGRGDLQGAPLAWRARGNAVTLIVDGAEEPGRIEGDRLQFAEFTFTRLKGKSASSPTPTSKAKSKAQAKSDQQTEAAGRIKLPPKDEALAERIVGCWRRETSSTDSNSYSRSNERWTFTANGRYTMTSRNIASGEFGSVTNDDAQQGQWTTAKGHLLLKPDGKEGFAAPIRFQGQIAIVDGKKYLPCR